MIGGGTGPAEGTRATTCSPGEWNIHRMLEAAEGLPLNFGFLGKGNASRPEALIEQIVAGAMGLKLHEDFRIITGRTFISGKLEVIVGRRLAQQFALDHIA